MVDRKISDFADGGAVQSGDEFAIARSGENYRVNLGTAVNFDVGDGVGEIVVLDDDGGGNPRYPAGDGSLITGLSVPDLALGDLTNVTTTGADDDGVQYGFLYDSVSGSYSLTPAIGATELSDLVDTSGADTDGAKYGLEFDSVTGGYSLQIIDDTAATAYPIETVTGSVALDSDYAFKYVVVDSASPVTLTVTEPMPANAEIIVWQEGAGSVTFAMGSGVTVISNPGTLVMQGTGSTAALKRIADGEYNLTIAPVISIDTADVANNAITYEKMQDVSTTNRVLGRVTAGSGDVEEIPLGGVAAGNVARFSSVGSLEAGTAWPFTAGSDAVAALGVSGTITGSRSGNPAGQFYRISSDGDCVRFYRNTSQVGSVSVTTTNATYNTSSDYRLKENVEDYSSSEAAALVMQLRPVEFNFIIEPEKSVIGFIAHEVQALFPIAVTGVKDAQEVVIDPMTDQSTGETIPLYQQIDHSKLVPLLTAALQDALKRIEVLESNS
jgi:hypothetical protein